MTTAGGKLLPQAIVQALERPLSVASQDTGQGRHVADFLLYWHNAEENGNWSITDLWSVDTQIADDMLALLVFIRHYHRYPHQVGFGPQMQAVWNLWRAKSR